jgi:cysteine-rich repeat protein
MIDKKTMGLTVMLAAYLVATSAHAATDPKVARNCRKEIAAKMSKVVKTGIKVLATCHTSRDKGKFSGNCNDLATADVKGAYAKALGAATKSIDKKCVLGNAVLGNYANGDADGALFPVIAAAVEQLGQTALGTPALVGDKAKVKCHGQVAKAIAKVVDEILKGSVKCQAALDKTATAFGELAGACLVAPLKSGSSSNTALAKKCVGLGGGDLGGCNPLFGPSAASSCVVTSSTATGESLAIAIFGEPTPGCGNGITDPGEDCDDGNAISTDACIACKAAACGDGFVEAGVELCGDAPADACATPSPDTCAQNLQPCGDSGGRQSVKVRFTKPAGKNVTGLQIALDYPETKVGVPGFANESAAEARVTDVPAPFFSVNDRDYEIEVSANSIDPIPAGDFFTVELDACVGASGPAALSEFGCVVRQASDDQNALITNQVGCSVVVP